MIFVTSNSETHKCQSGELSFRQWMISPKEKLVEKVDIRSGLKISPFKTNVSWIRIKNAK
jgi:hypothetical protein